METKNSMYINLYKKKKIDYSKMVENIDFEEITKKEIGKFFSSVEYESEIIKVYERFSEKYEEEIVIDIFIKTVKKPEIIYEISKYINNPKLINKLATALIKTRDAKYIYEFVHVVKGSPINILAEAVIETGNAKYIYEFAHVVKGAPVDELAEAVIETRNAEYIYYFAHFVEGAPIDKLLGAVIKTRNAEYIYAFARYIKGAPIDELAEAVIKIGDANYIYKFICYIEESPIKKLMEALLNLKAYGHIQYLLNEYSLDKTIVEETIEVLKLKGVDVIVTREKYNFVNKKDTKAENKNKGLVETLENNYNPKSYYLDKLVEGLPETELKLQVYLKFLTTDMSIEEAKVLDLEYKKLVLEKAREEAEESQEKEVVQVHKPVE